MIRALTILLLMTAPALAHEWYSEKRDPVYSNQSCCGGEDCAQLVLTPGVLAAEERGYRIRLTLQQARRINPNAIAPIDALVPWSRVQPSMDGNYHICIMPSLRNDARQGVYCFFEPPST
jgi:hypothetical protein